MSRGYGHVERSIVGALERLKADFTTVTALARAMGKAKPTRSDPSFGGISRPSAFGVLRLMTRSNAGWFEVYPLTFG
jgi:hypothetical protein